MSTESFPVLWFNYATGILAVYSLYWLNRGIVREYFASDKSPKCLGNRALKVCASIMVGLYVSRVLLTIVPSLWLVYSGSTSWAHTKADLLTRGEKLTFPELIQQKVPPPEENFFADPLWMGLLETKPAFENGTWIQKPIIAPKDSPVKKYFTPLTPAEKEAIKWLPTSEGNPADRSRAAKNLNNELEIASPKKQISIAGQIVEILGPLQPLAEHLQELLLRPSAYYPLRYQANFSLPLPHVTDMLTLAQMFRIRAQAELVLGKIPEAFKDVMLILGLQQTMKDQPVLIVLLVRESMLLISVLPMDAGILHHQWSDSELVAMQDALKKISFLQDEMTALRGERACFYCLMWQLTEQTKLPSWRKPSDIMYAAQMDYYAKTLQASLDTMERSKETGWNASLPIGVGFKPRGLNAYLLFMVSLAMPAIENSVSKSAECQTVVDQSLIACALERYHVAYGSYPTSLEVLVPKYLDSLPNSPITGKPMNYSLKADGTFSLWSVGWNLKTLNGKPGWYAGDGDIVWNQKVSSLRKPFVK